MSLLKRAAVLLTTAAFAFAQCAPVLAADDAPLDLNLPSLGTVAGADLSIMEERRLGEQIMRKVRADADYLADPEALDYLNRLGYRLVAASHSIPYDFFFFPVREKSLNAFALPGGFIAVHTGLVVAAKTESELAAVLGHEIGHVTQRHIARMYQQNRGTLAMTIGSFLLALLAARAGGSSGGDAAAAITMGTQAALIQKQLGYSRDAEREADRVGLQSLTSAGFDPKGMEDFFARLQQSSRYYETIATAYISTHPMTSERMNDMQGRTRHLARRHHEDSFDFLLIQARLRVLQEKNYDGWLAASKSFSLQLEKATGRRAAALHYGLSVAYAKMNRKAAALEHARTAQKLAPQHSVILDKNLAQAEYDNAKGGAEKRAALRIARATVDRYPYSFMAAESYVEMLHQMGLNEAVVKFMRKQRAIPKDNTDYHALLARSYHKLGRHAEAFAATGDMYALMGNHKAAVYQFDLAQRANDADYYVMSMIDAKLREQRQLALDQDKDKKR
jgi:predicted Zn-dependent protease